MELVDRAESPDREELLGSQVFNKILVAVGTVEDSSRAADTALTLARLSHGEVLVVHAVDVQKCCSGGEEDLANLVLRLAISQMIAERSGQSFSLLILDEVFGSLDESRRQHVLELLRSLHHRFEQVIVITHIEGVRDGLDRVISVRYNEETGASDVSRGEASGVTNGDSGAELAGAGAA